MYVCLTILTLTVTIILVLVLMIIIITVFIGVLFINQIYHSFLNTAFATPYFEDNELKGYKLQSIDPGSPLLSLGLRPSDVIVKADNQPITSIAKAQEIVASASTLDSLVITVLRNGQEVSLNYKVSK